MRIGNVISGGNGNWGESSKKPRKQKGGGKVQQQRSLPDVKAPRELPQPEVPQLPDYTADIIDVDAIDVTDEMPSGRVIRIGR